MNDTVWERTHRLGGWLFVLIGGVGIGCSFIPWLRIWGTVALLLLAVVFLVWYSYWLYQQLGQSGDEPLSPPFAGE